MPKSVPNDQVKAFIMAISGAAIAAVATMLVPVSVIEGITGATGLSELVPAAAAPLGDTARALIAFAAGALTLATLGYLLLRQDSVAVARPVESVPASQWAGDEEKMSFKERLASIRLPEALLPKMPWTKNEDDITELADLPKLRNGDSHPDAPARRPLVASLDLPVLDLADIPDVQIQPAAQASNFADVVETLATPEPALAPAPQAPPEALPAAVQPGPARFEAMSSADVEPTLADMVAQLEAAVADRQKQLVQLEAVATELSASRPAIARGLVDAQPQPEIVAANEIFVDEPRAERPALEAVPQVSVKDDDMDSALAAALATLHRMNATGR